jgi:hypothetical protein
MGVDGINGAGPSGPPDALPATDSAGAATPFSATAAGEARPVTDLDRVASGELSVEQYLDARVERATGHLANALSPDQLAAVQEELREQLATDPMLQRLVQRTLGATAPEPPR